MWELTLFAGWVVKAVLLWAAAGGGHVTAPPSLTVRTHRRRRSPVAPSRPRRTGKLSYSQVQVGTCKQWRAVWRHNGPARRFAVWRHSEAARRAVWRHNEVARRAPLWRWCSCPPPPPGQWMAAHAYDARDCRGRRGRQTPCHSVCTTGQCRKKTIKFHV